MIVVFGSINLDLVARTERLPQPGETIAGLSFAMLPGGKGANQAIAARRAGAEVAMAGAVGTDLFAAAALSGLVAAGVDVAWVRRDAAPTGVALIHVEASGQNAITVIPGANAHVLAATVPDAALGPGTTLVLQLEVPLDAVCDIASRARLCGARVVLNAAPARSMPATLLAVLDVLIVNAIEAATLAAELGLPDAPETFAAAMHRRHGCAVIVTLGPRGALASVEGTLFIVAAPAVDVVDTTGAGDAFAGALVAALDRRTGWPRALAEGVAAGSLACTAAGAQTALPAAAAIRRLAIIVESTLASRPLD
jgi:ribokinase